MKTIRINVFETNSSSSHSVVLLDYFDYERWVNEKDACYDFDKNEIISISQRNSSLSEEEREEFYDKLPRSLDIPLTYQEFEDYVNGFKECEMEITDIITPKKRQAVLICYYNIQ